MKVAHHAEAGCQWMGARASSAAIVLFFHTALLAGAFLLAITLFALAHRLRALSTEDIHRTTHDDGRVRAARSRGGALGLHHLPPTFREVKAVQVGKQRICRPIVARPAETAVNEHATVVGDCRVCGAGRRRLALWHNHPPRAVAQVALPHDFARSDPPV